MKRKEKSEGYIKEVIERYRPGLRIVKTTLSIFLCLLIDYIRGDNSPIISAIAAMICLKPKIKESQEVALDRFIGTIIGGVYGYVFVKLVNDTLGLETYSIPCIILVSIAIIPLMEILLHSKGPGAVTIGTIVFLLIAMGNYDTEPEIYSINRVVETFVGISAALFVNWLPILNPKRIEEENESTGE